MKSQSQLREDFFVFAVPTIWFFLFLPLDIYRRNRDEWGVPVGEFLLYGFVFALGTALLLSLASFLLGKKGGLYLKTLSYFLFSVACIHTFLPVASEERELTGILLDFHFSWKIHLLSLTAMGAAGWLLFHFRQHLFASPSSNYAWISAIILVGSLLLAWSSMPTVEGGHYRTAGKLSPSQLQELYTLSSQRNVILLILDTVPADVALEVLEEQEEHKEEWQDFAFYKNNLSIAPQTYMSMANLHIGSFWRESFDEHQQASPLKVRDHSFFNLLVDAGWKLAMAGRGPCPNKLDNCGSTNTQNLGFGVQVGFSEPFMQALNLALFKTSPIALKKWVYNDEDFLLQSIDIFRLRSTDAGSALHIPRFDSEAQRDNYFLTFLADHGSVGDATPRFKLFHLMSTHPRFYLDTACQKGPITDDRNGMKKHLRCAFDAIAHLVRQLRVKGVYDTTTLIVAGDHGINYPSAFVPVQSPSNMIPHFPEVVTQANALLMIKQENTHLSLMKISESPTSTVDLTNTICEIAILDCQQWQTDSLSLLHEENFPMQRIRLYAHHGYGAENAERHGMDLYAVQGALWRESHWQFIAHLPGKGGGTGDAARAALNSFVKTEKDNSAE